VSGNVSVNGARFSAPTLAQALENITGSVALRAMSRMVDQSRSVGLSV